MPVAEILTQKVFSLFQSVMTIADHEQLAPPAADLMPSSLRISKATNIHTHLFQKENLNPFQ